MVSKILTQILDLINTGHTLPQAVEATVPGADPAYWQQVVKRHESKPAASPQKSSKKSNSRKSSGRTMRTVIRFDLSFAEKTTTKTNRATAELVARENGKEEPRFVNSVLEVF